MQPILKNKYGKGYTRMKLLIQCEECDSEYFVEYEDGLLADDPKFCIVCGNIVESEFVDEEDLDSE